METPKISIPLPKLIVPSKGSITHSKSEFVAVSPLSSPKNEKSGKAFFNSPIINASVSLSATVT